MPEWRWLTCTRGATMVPDDTPELPRQRRNDQV